MAESMVKVCTQNIIIVGVRIDENEKIYLREIQKRDELIKTLQTENHNLRQTYLNSVREYNEAKRKYQAALDDLKAWKANYEKDMQNFLDNFTKNTDEES